MAMYDGGDYYPKTDYKREAARNKEKYEKLKKKFFEKLGLHGAEAEFYLDKILSSNAGDVLDSQMQELAIAAKLIYSPEYSAILDEKKRKQEEARKAELFRKQRQKVRIKEWHEDCKKWVNDSTKVFDRRCALLKKLRNHKTKVSEVLGEEREDVIALVKSGNLKVGWFTQNLKVVLKKMPFPPVEDVVGEKPRHPYY